MPKLTRGHLEKSYGAKVWGARHLRCGLSDGKTPWDFALLFSSTSALLGFCGSTGAAVTTNDGLVYDEGDGECSPGQGNYSAANAALDGHARYWKQENVISVQWGPWKEVGMAAQKGTVERLRQSGVGALSNAFGMAAYLKQYPKIPPFLSKFASEVKTAKPKKAAAPAAAFGAAMAPAVPQVDKVLGALGGTEIDG
eukprot:Skav203411  [mRNA]  locus=scaffold1743:237332:243479:- [translate_table: standard]